jgi:uncharacterized protein DUF4389
MIVFRMRYPRWWFDFARELTRFGARVGAYLALLTDRYPSTVEEQSVHLEIDYPDVDRDLNRWLPLVKWLLAIPHYIVLTVLWLAVVAVVVIAWFAILIAGRYPRSLFDFVVGVGRWTLRVIAYAFLLITDRYPPFTHGGGRCGASCLVFPCSPYPSVDPRDRFGDHGWLDLALYFDRDLVDLLDDVGRNLVDAEQPGVSSDPFANLDWIDKPHTVETVVEPHTSGKLDLDPVSAVSQDEQRG